MISSAYAVPAIIAVCLLVAIIALIAGAVIEGWFYRLRHRHDSDDHEMLGGTPL